MKDIIVVGVNGSDTAKITAERAAKLAVSMDAELLVVVAHVGDHTEVISIGTDTWIIDDADTAQKLAKDIADQLLTVEPTLNVRSTAGHGKPQDVIVSKASEINATLIVVGSVGMKGFGRVLGSVATSVSHNASCDVYIVKTA